MHGEDDKMHFLVLALVRRYTYRDETFTGYHLTLIYGHRSARDKTRQPYLGHV